MPAPLDTPPNPPVPETISGCLSLRSQSNTAGWRRYAAGVAAVATMRLLGFGAPQADWSGAVSDGRLQG
jgi:hypothetical protein